MRVLDSDVEQLLARITEAEIPLSAAAILEAVEQPRWDAESVRDWQSHVPGSIRQLWDELSLAARICVFDLAERAAWDSNVGTPMITGPSDYIGPE